MADKLIQYDAEVAVNEDLNDIQDLATRTYNKALEGLQYYESGNAHGAGSYFIPLRILGGFDVIFAADGTLNFAISNGDALVAHDESTESDGNIWSETTSHYYTQNKRNNVLQARHSTYSAGVYPYAVLANAEVSKDRIDIIEIKFSRVDTSETRHKLVTVDNRRVVQDVSLLKYNEYVMSDVRIRQGYPVAPPASPSYDYGPRMPALDPSVSVPSQFEWMPIAAVYIPANTTGFAVQPAVTDLRLFYQPKLPNGLLQGAVQQLSVTTQGSGPSGGPWDQLISIAKNIIADNGEFFPISGSSKNCQSENPYTGWNQLSVGLINHSYTVQESCWPLLIDAFYYIYSFRASSRIGTTGLCVTNEAPADFMSSTYGKAGNPYSSISPPTPWPNRYDYTDPNNSLSGTLGPYIKEHAFYLTSFKCYEDLASSIVPRPYKKYGNYVSLTGYAYDFFGGSALNGTDSNLIFYGIISGSTAEFLSVTAYTDPAYDGGSTLPGTTRVVPAHASAMRLRIHAVWNGGTGSASLRFFSEEGENNPATAGYVFVNHDFSITSTGDKDYDNSFIMPLQQDYDTMFWIQTPLLSAGCSVSLKVYVEGYYEQF